MINDEGDTDDRLIERASGGDETALAELFDAYRPRLKAMVSLRLDRRLQGRVDASDVLQDAYLELARRLPEFREQEGMPFFLWLRLVTGQRLLHVHRRHLQTAMRDVSQEISIYRGTMPQASSISLAGQLLGRMTSVSHRAIRAEVQVKLQESLNALDPIDREILVLRHFEELSNKEAALVLGLSKTATSNRYVRALKRLGDVLAEIPGLLGND